MGREEKINFKIREIEKYRNNLIAVLEDRKEILNILDSINENQVDEICEALNVSCSKLSLDKKRENLNSKLLKEIEYNNLWINISNRKIEKLINKKTHK